MATESERREPTELPQSEVRGDAAAATQLTILMTSAMALVDDEFKRSERLDAKARNHLTVAAVWFAVVQALVVSLLGGALRGGQIGASPFVPWLASMACVGATAMVAVLMLSLGAWRLRSDVALGTDTIRYYVPPARAGSGSRGNRSRPSNDRRWRGGAPPARADVDFKVRTIHMAVATGADNASPCDVVADATQPGRCWRSRAGDPDDERVPREQGRHGAVRKGTA